LPRRLSELAIGLARGRLRSRDLVESCLDRIADPEGEGARAFIAVAADKARAAADAIDAQRAGGTKLGPFAGIPISVKDLFDIAGEVTTAGSTVLRGSSPAQHDALAVARLRAQGFIILGRTNMTEFAFSGLGLNPHYGNPLSPWERATRRIPGGSSSGAAVSVSDGMAGAGLGTDTGGSSRIPAAFCGIVGFKPTARRVPLTGTYPLSITLDSIGPLANSVECCESLDAVLAGETPAPLAEVDLPRVRLALPRTLLLDGLDPEVARSFERAVQTLARAGAQIEETAFKELSEIGGMYREGGIPAGEAYALHRKHIETGAAQYDPRVLARILRGRDQARGLLESLKERRIEFIERVTPTLKKYDALLMPTVAMVPPPVSAASSDEEYTRLNALALRNTATVNFMDGCAISIPCHESGYAPVGLSLFTAAEGDRQLLRIAAAAEQELLAAQS
jgi:aspartyl-tRNA(Asn)/glutamyl-tRNA(Gln) amidotransferase subunit A